MEILILTPKEETVKMSTRKGESVIDLKKTISEKLFMAPDLQRILFFHGRVLDDENSLDQLAIEDKSVITLVEGLRGSGIRILAKTIYGETAEIEIDPTETVLNLKKIIEEKLAIEEDFQRLVYLGCRINDEEKLQDHSIKDGSVINVLVSFVRRHSIRIILKIFDSITINTTEMDIDPSGTVLSLKKIIHEKIDIEPEMQKIIIDGRLINDEENLEDYLIMDGSVINVVRRFRVSLLLCVMTSDGHCTSVECMGNDTVLDVKRKITEKLSITPDLQELHFQGVILDDEKKMADFPFCSHSVINLIETASREILFRISDDRTVKLEMGGTKTVRDLKKRIARKLSFTMEELILVFQDIVLDDDTMVDTLNILEDSVISVNINERYLISERRIYFENDGKEISVQVGMKEKVSDIKRRICEKAQSSSTDVQLCYKGGRRLEDDKTLLDYYIIDTTQIRVLFLW